MAGATHVGNAVNSVCLDSMRLYLMIEDGVVKHATFQASGCVPSIAAGSLATELFVGRTQAELTGLVPEQIEASLGGLPATKKHAAFLVCDALHDALSR